MSNLVTKLSKFHNLTDEEFKALIFTDKYDEELYEKASAACEKVYGNKVYIRGLIEFTNYCKNDCYYCGIRHGNKALERYRLTKEEILLCCEKGNELGFKTFVLQGGEDPYYTDSVMCDIISSIRKKYPDCAITLSIGEKDYSSYKAFFDAGANRFLLRHETADCVHYNKLHPESMTLENRKRCLFDLKKIGYQVGSGFMVGSPFQTEETIISDLRFLQELNPHMIGIGPYVNHKDTPFSGFENGSVILTLRLISVLRLMFPYALIPATTALGTLHPNGRELGFKAGANVVMPNLSPSSVRQKYQIYENKLVTGAESAENIKKLINQAESAGRRIVFDRGDAKAACRCTEKAPSDKKVLVAMSGGVDSSVAALFAIREGYKCAGATMKLHHSFSEGSEKCSSEKDIEDARKISHVLGMEHFVYDFSDKFISTVIDNFITSYENGLTPNPCVICNRYLKFEALSECAVKSGYDYVATGHYARIEKSEENGRFLLKKAIDESKDQSYFLYSLTQEQLSRTLFPLGSLTKDEVRAVALENGFTNAEKSDSQDICFIDGFYADFIESFTNKKYPEGNFCDKDGNVLGTHKGIIRYTVGQRKGLGVSFGEPMFVTKVDPVTNTVFLGKHEELFSSSLTCTNLNLISVEKLNEPIRVKAKIRYRHKEADATVTQTGSDTAQVIFDEPQRAITKGQTVVFYDGDVVVGGGIIS